VLIPAYQNKAKDQLKEEYCILLLNFFFVLLLRPDDFQVPFSDRFQSLTRFFHLDHFCSRSSPSELARFPTESRVANILLKEIGHSFRLRKHFLPIFCASLFIFQRTSTHTNSTRHGNRDTKQKNGFDSPSPGRRNLVVIKQEEGSQERRHFDTIGATNITSTLRIDSNRISAGATTVEPLAPTILPRYHSPTTSHVSSAPCKGPSQR
jgi:hypothetical protein